MKLPCLLFLLIATVCCNSKKKDNSRMRELHEQKLLLWEKTPEPYYNQIPDSMRKWVFVFKKVLIEDQRYRNTRIGTSLKEAKVQRQLDSLNQVIVTSFLDNYGWPTTLDVGFFGIQAIGMTIQHAPLQIQERYYSKLVTAYKRDKLLAETLSLLEDRINMRRKRYQYYGTQAVSYKGKAVVYPIYEIDSIDSRRRRIGLRQTIDEYLRLLQIEWKVDEYKEMLPGIIKEFRVSDSIGINWERQ